MSASLIRLIIVVWLTATSIGNRRNLNQIVSRHLPKKAKLLKDTLFTPNAEQKTF